MAQLQGSLQARRASAGEGGCNAGLPHVIVRISDPPQPGQQFGAVGFAEAGEAGKLRSAPFSQLNGMAKGGPDSSHVHGDPARIDTPIKIEKVFFLGLGFERLERRQGGAEPDDIHLHGFKEEDPVRIGRVGVFAGDGAKLALHAPPVRRIRFAPILSAEQAASRSWGRPAAPARAEKQEKRPGRNMRPRARDTSD